MIIIKKIVGIGNSRGVILPQEWLAEHERSYGHQILELSLEDRDKTLIITPLYNYGYDSLTWRTDEDERGPYQVASVKANEKDPKWTILLDKLERSAGTFVEDGWQFWRLTTFADLSHDSKLTEIFLGVGRKRVRVR